MVLNWFMRIIYLCEAAHRPEMGVVQKAKHQAEAWRRLGHTVDILWLGEDKPQWLIKLRFLGRFFSLLGYWVATHRVCKRIQSFQPDMIYSRCVLYSPALMKTYKLHKTILEMNSDLTLEKTSRSWLGGLYSDLSAQRLLNMAAGFVTVTFELQQRLDRFHRPTSCIPNSWPVPQYQPQHQTNSRPNVLFAGTPGQPWHGVDKIQRLIEASPEFDFHVVGTQEIRAANVKNYGLVKAETLDELIDKSDCGIGSMALHVIKLSEACPLKSRHYISRGLPLIYAYQDPDFSAPQEFALQIQNSENNVENELAKIKKFIVFCHRESARLRRQAHQFARQVIDSASREKARIQFFERVLHA